MPLLYTKEEIEEIRLENRVNFRELKKFESESFFLLLLKKMRRERKQEKVKERRKKNDILRI
jgi:hypothetical protein